MRISGLGHGIDRNRKVGFSFNHRRLTGFGGDTVASALLAKDIKLVARSFKYHRPRGVMALGSEEPNALITVGTGDAAMPNLRATQVELMAGLKTRSQNAWPSIEADFLAVNDFVSPFLSAGFYYKTFMWPRGFWEKLYEPFIRRAAGLGKLPMAHDLTPHEKAFAHCDVLVIGSGPTGLIAAWAAAEAGADVILCEEDTMLGGRLLHENEEVDGTAGHLWAADMSERLAAMPNVRIMTRTTVTGAYDTGVYGALERVGRHVFSPDEALPMECFWRITARATVLAAGALERPIAFENNDRPGILLSAATRGYLHRYGVAPGSRVAVFGTGPDAHRTARDLKAAGVEVPYLVDTRSDAPALEDTEVISGARVTGTRGRKALRSITVGARKLEVDALAVAGGWTPSVHLTCHMNHRPVWDEGVQAFVPAEGAVPGMVPAGACRGVYSTAGCLQDGLRAASDVLDMVGLTPLSLALPAAENGAEVPTPLWHVPGQGRAWLDFQNDVTVKDVKLAAAENYASVEHMKRYTTQGMAPDQGKNSNLNALAVLAEATGRSIPETGTTTFRPPYVPVALGAIGAGARGSGFAPRRLTTSDPDSRAMGAPMIEAGLWFRPSYFPRSGETHWRDSCDREVKMVRETVGVTDVSTLGKIDIQGADAARFLDLVYANKFSTLKPGKARYGLMLREDGHVMDDGTTACLGDGHYMMTTTTAAAGPVMSHLEFVAQCLVPDWDVHLISATEQWAQFAVAGPMARAMLETLVDDAIDDATLPFMGWMDVTVGGVAGRLFRISFSGEMGFEIAVPARYGASLFRLLIAQAGAFGGGAYGMEALNVLRIEKGFITHSEIHGRVTAFDVGMEGMVSKKKDCIGFAASRRDGLLRDDRERLIGLKPVAKDGQVLAGAHLFTQGDKPIRVNDQGYVTSVGYSPSLGCMIGLGFLRSGPDRIGERVRMVDHLRKVTTEVEICAPVFLDPEGERARG